MPFLWTEGRFIMNRLEVPTLKEIPAERIYEQVLVGGGSILLKKHIEACRFSLMKYPPILRAMSYCSKPLVWGDVNGEEGYEKRVKILQSYGILTLFYFLYMDSQKL